MEITMRHIPTLFLTTTFLTATTTYGSGIAEFHPSPARPSAAAVAPVSAKTRAEEIEDFRQQANDSTVALWQRLDAIDKLIEIDAANTPDIISMLKTIATDSTVDFCGRLNVIKKLIKIGADLTPDIIRFLETIATNPSINPNALTKTTAQLSAIDGLIKLGADITPDIISALETIATSKVDFSDNRLDAIKKLIQLDAAQTPDIITALETIATNPKLNVGCHFDAIDKLIQLDAANTPVIITALETIATDSEVNLWNRFNAIDKLIQLGVNDKAITALETIIKKEELWYMPRAKELLEKASGASKPTPAAVEAAVAPNADDDDAAPVAVVEAAVAVAQSPATLIQNLKVQLAQILKKYKGAVFPYWVGHTPRKDESAAKHTAYKNYLDNQAEVDRIRGELARLEPAEAPAAARRR
jgi:hypothetical protein